MVSGLAIGASLGVTAAPAHAITEMSVDLQMKFMGDVPLPDTVAAQYTAFLPTDSALGYLVNGASITVRCWGRDDSWSDNVHDFLFSKTWTYGAPGAHLYADSDGVRLYGTHFSSRGDLFDEDNGSDIDEVYCKMTWRDGDGATITRSTPVRTGSF